jgi:hypothetical protein
MSVTVEIIKVTPEDALRQQALLNRVDSLLDSARENQEALHRNYIEIGAALLEVQKTKAWVLRERSYDSYVMACGKRFSRGRSALYGYVSVVERLSPYVKDGQLVEMGISKSQPLAQYVKQTGKKPPESLINKALDPEVSVEQFRADIARETHQPENPKAKWFDLGGFYCTADERREIERAFDVATRVDPPIPDETPEIIKRKEIIQRFAMEFLSQYETTLQG